MKILLFDYTLSGAITLQHRLTHLGCKVERIPFIGKTIEDIQEKILLKEFDFDSVIIYPFSFGFDQMLQLQNFFDEQFSFEKRLIICSPMILRQLFTSGISTLVLLGAERLESITNTEIDNVILALRPDPEIITKYIAKRKETRLGSFGGISVIIAAEKFPEVCPVAWLYSLV